MRVAFFGTPEFALPSLEALLAAGFEIPLVVSRADRPAGRHLELTRPPVAVAAERLGIAVAQPEKLGVDEFYRPFVELRPDAAAVVAFGRLITPRVLGVPRLGFVNVHPSLLPRHRGPTPIETAILAGDPFTGVTTMQLDEGLDTGPILLQRRVPIGPRERTATLEPLLARVGAELLVETLRALAAGSLRPRPQDEREATVTVKLERKMGRIDWTLPAEELDRRCRAFDPFPGLYCNFRGARVKVHDLRPGEPVAGGEEPGTVLGVSPAGIAVRCGGGTVAMLGELQREGKRRLPADAFILGERVARGERFG
ncbi:MAG TPA: methionyl-tRNA formyltransferase [Thermoanaerobaculaceae bacterium]|nr:methionyl-tRNA formyltransferase [Thermoanaerobaculaceae bacterium]HRS15667.1 methionyl-tRNA formyltransferase [Thermoanaerobaculaceae bacterium]